jgi:hypothetical protein
MELKKQVIAICVCTCVCVLCVVGGVNQLHSVTGRSPPTDHHSYCTRCVCVCATHCYLLVRQCLRPSASVAAVSISVAVAISAVDIYPRSKLAASFRSWCSVMLHNNSTQQHTTAHSNRYGMAIAITIHVEWTKAFMKCK